MSDALAGIAPDWAQALDPVADRLERLEAQATAALTHRLDSLPQSAS